MTEVWVVRYKARGQTKWLQHLIRPLGGTHDDMWSTDPRRAHRFASQSGAMHRMLSGGLYPLDCQMFGVLASVARRVPAARATTSLYDAVCHLNEDPRNSIFY